MKSRSKFFFLSLGLLLFGNSCGYQLVNEEKNSYKIFISPIDGDNDGLLIQSIIMELSRAPMFSYSQDQSDYDLKIRIIGTQNSYSDFQYQTNNDGGSLINRLSPIESKYELVLALELRHAKTGKKILGPLEIRDFLLYDYFDYRSYNDQAFVDSQGQNLTSLSFSLGQLASEDDAKASVKKLLYKKLGNKITRCLLTRLSI